MNERTTVENVPERQQAVRQWYEENKQAVDAYNEMIETHGLFSDGVRMF